MRHGPFTASFPRPSQVVLASLTAAPRTEPLDGPKQKPSLDQRATRPATAVDSVLLEDADLYLECELDRRVDELGETSLLIGRVKAVHVDEDVLRTSEPDDGETVRENPLLAYRPPDRYAIIDESHAFPFPAGFGK